MEKTSRSKLNNRETILWLNSRYKENSALKYRTTPEEYKIHQIIQTIFQKFDFDKSSPILTRNTRTQGSIHHVRRKQHATTIRITQAAFSHRRPKARQHHTRRIQEILTL